MNSCVTPTAFGKLQECSTYAQHRGPVRADVIPHPCSSLAYLGPDCTINIHISICFIVTLWFSPSKYFWQLGKSHIAGSLVAFLHWRAWSWWY